MNPFEQNIIAASGSENHCRCRIHPVGYGWAPTALDYNPLCVLTLFSPAPCFEGGGSPDHQQAQIITKQIIQYKTNLWRVAFPTEF